MTDIERDAARYRWIKAAPRLRIDSLPEALKLSRLIEKACDRSRQKAIDRAADGILRLLTEQHYN